MQATDGLKRVLVDLAQSYLKDDNQAGTATVEVEFTDGTPRADPSGHTPTVYVSPDVKDTYGRTVDDTTQLRIIADILAHEVEHVNQSDLHSKQEVAEANPDMPQAAGMAANILEDRYIDAQRMDRNPGQRTTHKVKIDALMENHQRRPRVDTLLDKEGMVHALIEAALQVTATGTAVDASKTGGATTGWFKGQEDMDPSDPEEGDVLEFAVRWDDMATRAEDADDLDERMEVIQEGVDLIREYAPDGTTGRDVDDAADEQGGGNLFDDDEAPDPADMDMDPADMDRDADVSERLDPDDAPDMDDLADELDDLGDDGWDDTPDAGQDAPDADGGDSDPQPDDAPDADPDDGPDADGATDGADGDAPDDPADGSDGGTGDGADAPDADGTDGDGGDGDGGDGTGRIDRILDQYGPDQLEVTE